MTLSLVRPAPSTELPDLYVELAAAIRRAAVEADNPREHTGALLRVVTHDEWCVPCRSERDPVLCVDLHDLADEYIASRLAEVGGPSWPGETR